VFQAALNSEGVSAGGTETGKCRPFKLPLPEIKAKIARLRPKMTHLDGLLCPGTPL
jgi:hypothetical protein